MMMIKKLILATLLMPTLCYSQDKLDSLNKRYDVILYLMKRPQMKDSMAVLDVLIKELSQVDSKRYELKKPKKMEMNPQFHAAELVLNFMSILVKKQESKLCAKKHCDLMIMRYESLDVKDNVMISYYNDVKKYIDAI